MLGSELSSIFLPFSFVGSSAELPFLILSIASFFSSLLSACKIFFCSSLVSGFRITPDLDFLSVIVSSATFDVLVTSFLFSDACSDF